MNENNQPQSQQTPSEIASKYREPIDFSKKVKKRICKHCGKERGSHKANTLNCPSGAKYKIGYLDFSPTQTFEEK